VFEGRKRIYFISKMLLTGIVTVGKIKWELHFYKYRSGEIKLQGRRG
jgi:hypothetical protein